MPFQEKGIRPSCALPYELYADGKLTADKKTFEIIMKAGNEVFGNKSAGSPFHIYAPGVFKNEAVETWSYAVAAGDVLNDSWQVSDFEDSKYHLRVYGPNGFFREFTGNQNDSLMDVHAGYEKKGALLSGNIQLILYNKENHLVEIEIKDNSYKTGQRSIKLEKQTSNTIVLNLTKSYGWYDFSVRIKGNADFEKRFAGRVETGKASKSDPLMGNFG